MKLLIVAAVLFASVFAEPESDAKADRYAGVYGSRVYGYPVHVDEASRYGAHYLGKRSAGLGRIYRGPVSMEPVSGRVTVYRGERSADSDAEARPWLTYAAASYPYAAIYAHAAYPYGAIYGAGYNGYALGYNGYEGAHYIGKREVQALPEARYGSYIGDSPYNPYGKNPYGGY